MAKKLRRTSTFHLTQPAEGASLSSALRATARHKPYSLEAAMEVVVASLLDYSTRARVRALLGSHVHLQIHSCRKAALAALSHVSASALLTDARPDPSMPADAFVRAVHRRFPTLPIVAVVHITSVDLRALLPIATAGVDDLIVMGADSPWEVIKSVLGAPALEASIETVLRTLRPWIAADAWPFVSFAVRAATRPLTVSDWSAQLGMQRTTLLRKIRALALPAPTALLTLGRLLVAAELVGAHGWTVKQTAETLYYSSASALRKSLRHHAHVRPHQTHTRNGLELVLDAARRILAVGQGTRAVTPWDSACTIELVREETASSLRVAAAVRWKRPYPLEPATSNLEEDAAIESQ